MASLPKREVLRGVITHREEGQTLPCIYKTHPSDEKHLYPLQHNVECWDFVITELLRKFKVRLWLEIVQKVYAMNAGLCNVGVEGLWEGCAV